MQQGQFTDVEAWVLQLTEKTVGDGSGQNGEIR